MNRLEGIIPPMVTPLLDEERLDVKGLNNLIEHLISGGVHGLFILGTTGEGPSLNDSLRIDLIEKVCEIVEGRIPVLVGLMDSSFKESVLLAEQATKLGAQAVVIAPPCFFQIGQDELYHFVDQLIDEITLPVYLYNNPALTKVSFALESAQKLLQKDKVKGIKDSSGDMIFYQNLASYTEASETSLFIGPEELLMESLLVGGEGGIPGGANIFPQLYVDLYSAGKSGDWQQAQELQKKVMKLSNTVYQGEGYGAGRVINGIKSTLKHLGVCNDYIAKPLRKAGLNKVKQIQQWVN
ncbi:MAG TPA: dihydrodipicolinate synthase family protein [Fodinibius sp.]|nr:dihydrodipicolinate synthase family protein [Fodinibius sp.]